MSMYPNSSPYMPASRPPTSSSSTSNANMPGNMINGTSQSNSMPMNMPTLQQQQQYILQQKQQIQQQQPQQQQQQRGPIASMPPPPSLSDPNMMSKFLPPSSTAVPPPPPPTSFNSPQSPPSSSSSISQPRPANSLQSNINGPNYAPPTNATQTTPTSLANNLPPHLRPPGLNGLHSSASLTNGGASETSANSSRTASPALKATTIASSMPPNQQQQTQQQQRALPPQQQGQTTNVQSNIGTLTGSLQNLNINRQNGAQVMPQRQALPHQQQQRQQQQQQQQQKQSSFMPPTSGMGAPINNFQANFKTNALSPTQPPMAFQSPPISSGTKPPYPQTIQEPSRTMTPTNALQQQPLPKPPQPQPPPTTSSSSLIANQSQMASMNAPRPVMLPPPVTTNAMAQQNANYTNNVMMSAPPTLAAMQQNQLNNNQQQQQQQGPPQSTQRRPMYPTAGNLPPMHPPSNMSIQQQQPYAQAYHQPQQQQPPAPVLSQPPGMFNGQQNTGPLQYQSQQAMLPPQQQQQQQQQQHPYAAAAAPPLQGGVLQHGFNKLWGQDTIDLMQNRHILTPNALMPPKVVLHNQFQESVNCNPNIMRCTIAKIPESNALLQKSRLPLGIVIHPFRDINSLPVIQCPNIVRCRLCRTYINPFVYFVDSKMWKCNLCYRTNELPEDFQFDPATKTYGDVTRRPEVRSSTIEFIAPSEYMLRPPPPAIYLFLFDVSIIAQQCGYLENVCNVLNKHIDDLPGDARTQIGFIAFNSQVHFYSMAEGYNQPHEMTLLDIDEPFLPRPDNLLVNIKECKELVKDLLTQLPRRFADTHDSGSALGAALQVAYKLMQGTGGRVTVFQTCLPNKGPGALELREDPNNRSAKDVAHLNPATDFYKRYALDSSGYQIAVDLFLLNQQYSDLATISGISKHSGGCVHHFPLYQKTKPQLVESLKQCFKRYLTRKIGFEAVMRIRCTRGLQVHTFHGNFFIRSTDLLSLPNVNPDAGFGMQISYEETLSDVKTICFQAALLYTNSEGERRIRVHTLCLPVTASLPEVMHSADAEAIIGLLSKMAVDRSLTSNVADAREAFLNATVDIFNAFKVAQNLPSGQSGQLIAPRSLALLPLYILALLKHRAFRVGISTRLDDRVFAMDCMKTLPLDQLMKYIYPEFYQIDVLFYNTQNPNAHMNSNTTEDDEEEDYLPDVPRLQLSAEYLDSRSIFLLDCGTLIILYVGINVPVDILEKVFGIKSTAELPDYCYGLPNVNSPENDALRRFIMRLNEDKPYAPTVQIIRDTSTAKPEFVEKLVDDRSESSLSYYEFLQHIRAQVK